MRQFQGFGQVRLCGVSIAAVAVLAGCGGGGDSSPSPSPAKYTQADIKHVAGLGTLAAIRTRTDVAAGIALVGAVLEGTSTSPNGAGVQALTPASCGAGGSYTMSITKPSAHAGIRAGDQVALTFAKCSFSAGLVLDGLVKVTARSTVALPLSSTFSASFDADMTGFSASRNGSTVAYTGVISATSSASVTRIADAFIVGASVPSGTTFAATISGGPAPFRLAYATGAKFEVMGSFTNNLAELKLDGDIEVGPAGALAQLTVATPTRITGPIPAGASAFAATAGAINVRATALNGVAGNAPATATTINGSTVTVSGDADVDGSLETVFTVSWAELISV